MPKAIYLRPDLGPNSNVLDQLMDPADHILDDYIRKVYRDGPLNDYLFVRYGVQRTLSQSASGRDFIQQCREVYGEPLARTSFFDSLHSERRQEVLAQLNHQVVRRESAGMADLLAGFPELQPLDIFAVDGHHIGHAVHSPADRKGDYVSANNLFLLCLHTGLLQDFGVVQGDGVYGHEMPAFRRKCVEWLAQREGPRSRAKPILVGDPAFVDNAFWTHMQLAGRARFITRTKSNMKPIVYDERPWDPRLGINEGVRADLLVGFAGSVTMRIVRYQDPESDLQYEFLTSVQDLQPGLIAMLYLMRWRIEKVFDTGKNRLEETKCWAVGKVAQEIRGHFFALTHNLLLVLRRRLETEEGMTEEKTKAKRIRALQQRQAKAKTAGRKVAKIQALLPAVVQLTAQFVRSLRNAILTGTRWRDALGTLRASMLLYL